MLPYSILKNKKDNLVHSLRKAEKIRLQMTIPLPNSPPISPFLVKQKETINPLEEENKTLHMQKKNVDIGIVIEKKNSRYLQR